VGPGHDSPQPRATTLGQQQHLTPPRGRLRGRHVSRESDILQGINSESGPPWESAGPLDIQSGPPSWSRTPTCTDRTPRMGSGPPPPPAGGRAAHSLVTGNGERWRVPRSRNFVPKRGTGTKGNTTRNARGTPFIEDRNAYLRKSRRRAWTLGRARMMCRLAAALGTRWDDAGIAGRRAWDELG
jgi:hypothetical protein